MEVSGKNDVVMSVVIMDYLSGLGLGGPFVDRFFLSGQPLSHNQSIHILYSTFCATDKLRQGLYREYLLRTLLPKILRIRMMAVTS